MFLKLKVRNQKSEINSIFAYRFFCLGFLIFSMASFSQENTNKPKIGLVLSGGGAKGFAHIGVLKVLEKEGVKIDYIGGTSMGAVVGGLYASGYSASQIDSIFKNTNFDELLKDYIPRDSKSFYEKHNDELYPISLLFNKFNIGVPIALSKGMYNYNLLTKLTDPVKYIRDFNKLPIPFVCISTDLETGKEVVFHDGYLPQAMLASSAFPTLFSPVEINGKLLVDGGVSNNYPVDEVRKMGADIIIGVDVQDDLKDRTMLKEATKIMVQITNLQMINKMKENVKKTTIYIKPDITNFSVISFDEGQKIIKTGEDAANLVIDKIRTIANPKKYVQQNMKLTAENNIITLKMVSINDVKDYTRAYIMGKLGLKENTKVTYQDIKKGINKLNATQNFSAISYSLDKLEDGDRLNLIVRESEDKTFLKFGLHYDGLYKSAILVNLTQKKSLFKNDVISADIALGDNFRYNLDYYIDNGFYFSFGLKSRLNQFNRNVATDFNNGVTFSQLGINTLNIDYLDFNNQAYLQTIFAQKFLIGAGIEWKHMKINSSTLSNQSSIFENSDYGSIFGYLKYDSFDNKFFPKKGWFFNGDIQSYLYSTNYTNQFNRFSIAKGEFGITRTFLKKINLKFTTEAGFSIGSGSVPFLDFVLGGYGYNTINNFKHFYGYDFVSLAADSYIKSTGTLDYEFYKKNHVNFSANYANLEDNLFGNGNWLSTPRYTGYALGYGLETVLGPIEVKYSWSPELSKGFTWFSVGFWF